MNAPDHAKLYGLDFVGHERWGRHRFYRFTDLLTGNTLEVHTLSQLSKAVLANRQTGFVDMVRHRAHDQAVKLSERFHGQAARFERDIDIEWPGNLYSLGVCARVDYIADKWGDGIVRYWHEFEGAVMLYADPDVQADGSQLLVIRGKFKIGPEGITG